MDKLDDLYNELQEHDVLIFEQRIPFTDAIVIEQEGNYGIFVDHSRIQSKADEIVAIAHEAGHIFSGTTHYNKSRIRQIGQHENRADKWAIKKLIPVDELICALENGMTEAWELAEYFSVTETFVKKAICYYFYGNLAAEQYL